MQLGQVPSGGNSTSTTGPTMATMRPSLSSVPDSVPGWVPEYVVLSAALLADGVVQDVDLGGVVAGLGQASAPLTISMISVVMESWRARFIGRLRTLISSSALSVADFMARWRAACSEAVASSMAANRRASA